MVKSQIKDLPIPGILLFIIFSIVVTSCIIHKSPLTIGIVPSESPEKLLKEFGPVQTYLEQELKRPIRVIIPADYREMILGMKEEKVDIGLFGPFSYIIADSQQDLIPLIVREKIQFGTSYNSLIVTSTDSDINSLNDLAGRKMAFVNPASTSGYIIPQSLFISRNIDISQYFSETLFSGSHDLVIKDVLTGKADAGAISNTILARLVEQNLVDKSSLKIIWESEGIPGSPYIARGDLDKRIRSSFTKAMLMINHKDPEALKAFDSTIEKYVPIDSGMYNPIRNIVNILGQEFIEKNYL